MLRFLLFSTFTFLFFIGCNSERADLRRIESVLPRMFQFGLWSRLFPEANLSDEICNSLLYSKRDESFYCAGLTLSSVGEEFGGVTNEKSDALLVKFDRRFKVAWVRQLGLRTQGSHSDFDQFRSLAEDKYGNIYASLKSSGLQRIFKYSPQGDLIDQITTTKVCHRLLVAQDRLICAGRDNDDAYVAKYYLDLRLDWEKTLKGDDQEISVNNASGGEQCHGLAVSQSGKIACVGGTSSALNAGFTPSSSLLDGFLWILTPDGQSSFLKQIGTNGYHEALKDVVFDKSENLILLGNYINSNGTGFINQTVTSGMDNGFLYRLNFVGGTYVKDPYLPFTNFTYETRIESMTLNPQGLLAICGQTTKYVSTLEPNAEPALTNRDVFVYLMNGNSWTFLKSKQFGSLNTGRFDNSGHQFCKSITHDQFGNFVLAGETSGNTNEPNAGGNAGTRDIMIWRVGPNLEF